MKPAAPPPPDPVERLDNARAQLAAAAVELVAAAIAAQAAGERYVWQGESPLGRRRHCELAAAGVFPAHKIGARWLVKQRDLDEYIQTHGTTPENRESVKALAAKLGADPHAGRRGRGKAA